MLNDICEILDVQGEICFCIFFCILFFCTGFLPKDRWKALSRLFRQKQIRPVRSFLSEEAVLITMQGWGDCSMLINLGAELFPSLDNGKPPPRPDKADSGAIGAGCFPIQSQVHLNMPKPVRCLADFPSIKLAFRHFIASPTPSPPPCDSLFRKA